MKNKKTLNFIIDVLMFILLMCMGGVGFLMKFVLVPGKVAWEIYGSNVDLSFLGWDRHAWGFVHLIMGYILLGLLALHVLLHWRQIKSLFGNLIRKRSLRTVLTLVYVPVCAALLLFAFFIQPEVITPKEGRGGHRAERARPQFEALADEQQDDKLPESFPEEVAQEREETHHEHTLDIFGSMSLREVAVRYDVPADSIKRFLGIPIRTSSGERLGRLRRAYGFHMSDVERYIEKYIQMHR